MAAQVSPLSSSAAPVKLSAIGMGRTRKRYGRIQSADRIGLDPEEEERTRLLREAANASLQRVSAMIAVNAGTDIVTGRIKPGTLGRIAARKNGQHMRHLTIARHCIINQFCQAFFDCGAAQTLVKQWLYRRESVPQRHLLQQVHDSFAAFETARRQYENAMMEMMRVIIYQPFDLEMVMVQQREMSAQSTLYMFGRHAHNSFAFVFEDMYRQHPEIKQLLASLQNPCLRMFGTNTFYNNSSMHSDFCDNEVMEKFFDRRQLFMCTVSTWLVVAALAGKNPLLEIESIMSKLRRLESHPGLRQRAGADQLMQECQQQLQLLLEKSTVERVVQYAVDQLVVRPQQTRANLFASHKFSKPNSAR